MDKLTAEELKQAKTAQEFIPLARIIEMPDGKYGVQTLDQHLAGTEKLIRLMCHITQFKETAAFFARHHDDGKAERNWFEYLISSVLNEERDSREKLPHSLLGGCVINSLGDISPEWCELGASVIWMHHGMDNIFHRGKHSKKESITDSKMKKVDSSSEIFSRYKQKALQEVKDGKNILFPHLKSIYYLNSGRKKCSIHFYRGQLFRYFLSLQIDADWTDSGNFASVQPIMPIDEKPDWKNMQDIYNRFIQNMDVQDTPLNRARHEISEQCFQAADINHSIFRLNVPTGAGKTLSAMRFALEQAQLTNAWHIFYIAPYNSILDQNYKVYSSIFPAEDILLHHSGIFPEEAAEDARSLSLRAALDNWEGVPIILTSAVQFMNALFSDDKRSVRRYHNLSNSIIILDEIQSYPPKISYMLNEALNFLTEQLDSDVVLCTATQPHLENQEYPLSHPDDNPIQNMVTMAPEMNKVFNRTQISMLHNMDETISAEKLAEMVVNDARKQSVMVITSTKKGCLELFRKIRDLHPDCALYHLSTNMYLGHRLQVLKDVVDRLDKSEHLILITTSIVEAGVDISFGKVYREFSGLENAVQSAGRCNRNGIQEKGEVILFKFDNTNLSHLPEVKHRSDAFIYAILNRYGEEVAGSILNLEEIAPVYFEKLNTEFKKEYFYPVDAKAVKSGVLFASSVFGMLSENGSACGKYPGFLRQSFKDAGRYYNYIVKYGIGVFVCCDKSLELRDMLIEANDPGKFRRILSELNWYCIQIPEYCFATLKGENYIAETSIGRTVLYFLLPGKYDPETGFAQDLELFEEYSF